MNFNKFHNVKVTHNGQTFHSKAELDYYLRLVELVDRGYIKKLYTQVTFQLPNIHYNAKKEFVEKPRNLRYITDFVLLDHRNRWHIIDTKGHFEKASQVKIAYTSYMYGVFIRILSTSGAGKGDTSFITELSIPEHLYNKKLPPGLVND